MSKTYTALQILAVLALAACQSASHTQGSTSTADAATGSYSQIIGVQAYVVSESTMDGNSGVAWDSKRNHLLHSITDFNTMKTEIMVTDMNVHELARIDVSAYVQIAQGVGYEAQRDVIWVWGCKLGVDCQHSYELPFTNSYNLAVIAQDGSLVENFETPSIDNYPGQFALTPDSAHIWLKANGQPIARLYDFRNGWKLLQEVDTGVGGEGVALDGNGGLWSHGGTWVDGAESNTCVVSRYDLNSGTSVQFASPSPRCGSEGAVFDGQGNLWITTDDGIHFEEAGGDKAWKISFK